MTWLSRYYDLVSRYYNITVYPDTTNAEGHNQRRRQAQWKAGRWMQVILSGICDANNS